MCDIQVSFENTQKAFAYKTDPELRNARFLFGSMKFTPLVKLGTAITPWAIKAGLPVKSIIRNTIFKQFVGGESLEETAPVVSRMGSYNVSVILDYGVEGGDNGESGFEQSIGEFIKVIEYASQQPNIPFISIKVTGFARPELLEKINSAILECNGSLINKYEQSVAGLTIEEQSEWRRVEERMDSICRKAAENSVGVLVDAEETWIQYPVDALSIIMMSRYNQGKPVVYNTIQLYRHDRLTFLKNSFEVALKRNFILGVKLVRGAYMEKERKRAADMGYTSPIQPDKVSTDRDYNEGVAYCLNHIERIATIIASHNEQSNLLAIQHLKSNQIPFDHPHVHFSQLYGMSDNITFNLAEGGCTVSKYLPFGPIDEVTPYLMRRAQENSSVAGQTGRELGLIKKEIARRRI